MICKIAKIESEVVYIFDDLEWHKAEDVELLSEGKGDSEGVVLIYKNTTRYLTNTQLDLHFILQKIVLLTEKIIDVTAVKHWLSALDSLGKPVAPVLGALPELVNIGADITAIKSELEKIKLR